MKKNMGSLDRSIRVILALVIATLLIMDAIGGILSIILLIIAGIFVATSFISFCPLYYPFRISTNRNKEGYGR